MPLLTLDDAKAQLGIPANDLEHDDEIQDFVDAAAFVVENHLSEAMTRRAFTEQRSLWRARSLALSWTPVAQLTSVTSVDGLRTWDVAGLRVDAATGVVRVATGPLLDGDLVVAYEAGYQTPPANYNLAGRIIVQHLWQTQRGSSGPRVGGALEDSFQNTVGGGRGYAIPNAALQLLGETGPVFA